MVFWISFDGTVVACAEEFIRPQYICGRDTDDDDDAYDSWFACCGWVLASY